MITPNVCLRPAYLRVFVPVGAKPELSQSLILANTTRTLTTTRACKYSGADKLEEVYVSGRYRKWTMFGTGGVSTMYAAMLRTESA